jgi:hypothetical protein
MEVHHHGHTERKKWTHYFWEFLMLFLAVTLGFLVENQREHYVEHNRAKDYAKSLVEDLAADTAELLDVIKEDKILLICFDSINTTIQKEITNNTVPGSFYYFCNIGVFSPTVIWYNATLTQITQSGNLRYFRNNELVKKLSNYYSNQDFISGMNDWDSRYRDENIKLRNRVLNNRFYSRYSGYTIARWMEIPGSLLTTRLRLQNSDPELLNEFANSFESRRRVLSLVLTRDYPNALASAKELIEMLKKEYHLE